MAEKKPAGKELEMEAWIWHRLSPSPPEALAYRQFNTVRANTGDNVRLPCRLSPEISAVAREIRWFKGTDCIKVYQRSGYETEEQTSSVRDVSLTLRDVKVTDSGQYRCEMLGEKKEEISVIHLHVSEFKLVFKSQDVGKPSRVQPLGHQQRKGSLPDFDHHSFFGDATLPCYLSPETSAVSMEIRWFKGTDCIYLYQNGQVTEGRGYEGRVSLFADGLPRGNVSLKLKGAQKSDSGRYSCEVTHGEHRVKTSEVRLTVSDDDESLYRGLIKPVPGKPGRRWSTPYEIPNM
ncbi:hypothetical protein MHYP_G00019840 [Metynnis hypsauchen]